MPKIVLPEFSLPKFSLPDFEFLKLSLPEFKLLELALPQFNLPNIEDLLGLIKIPTSPKLSWPNFSLPRISLPSFSLARLNSLRARLAALPPLPFTWEDSRLAILDIKNRFLEKLFSWKGYLASLDGDIKTEVADLPAGQAETPPPQIPSSNGGENEGSKIITFNTPSSPSFQTPPPQVKEIKTVVERVLSGISQSTLDQRLSDLNDSILLQVKNSLALIEKRIPSNQVQNPVVFLTTSIPGPSYNSPPQTGSGVSASFGDFSSGISTGGNLTASGNIILGQDTKTVDITSNTWKITSAGAASGFTSLSTDSLSASTFNVSGLLTTGGFISTASSTVVGNFTNQNATTTGYLAVTGMATSTFSNGIRLTGGCFLLLDGTCAGAGSGGITSLGGLTGATQTFSANGPLAIVSSGTMHTFNASSSPYFGALTASSTIIFSSLASGQLNSNGGLIYSGATTTFSSPLSYSGGVVSIPAATGGVNGYLSSTDWTLFNNKIGSTSLSATSPLSYNSSTGVIALNGTTTVSGLLAGNGGQIITSTTTSPLAWTLADGLTCTNCLNTATANGPLAITNSGSAYTFNASSSPFFGTIFATSTVRFSNLSAGAVSSSADGTLSSGTLTVANGGTGSTTLGGLLAGNGGQIITATTTSPLTYSISSGLGISQSNGGTNGYLSSTDWTLFNNKIGSTSLSATSPLSYNSSTGVIALNGTTTVSGLLAGNGGQIITSTTTSPLAWTLADGLTCTNCLNTATANGPLAITNSGSAYTFNASSSPFFGTIFATSTVRFSNLSAGAVSSSADGTLSSGTLTVANGGTGSTTLGGLLAGNGGQIITATTTSPLTYSISSGLGISQSNGGTNGYLSSTDWTLFNNKIGSTSLSATSPLSYNSSTGVIALNGTTTVSGLLAGNGGQIITSTTTSPLAWTLADGLTCTNCLNTATANGPLAITNSGSAYTFNASSSPFFGTIFATSTVRFSNLSAGAVSSSADGTLSSGTLTVANGGTGSTTLGGLLAGNGGQIIMATTTSPLTYSISSGLGISQYNGGTNGYLSSTDWTLFNNKIGSTSLSATSPLSYNSSTGVIALNGTTTVSGLLAGNGGQIITSTTTSPLAWTLADGLTCTNCLNTATANGPLAITNSGSAYTFNASSSPFFGTIFATSTVRFSNLSAGAVSSSADGTLSSGTLTVANGGTGSTTLGGLLAGNGGQIITATTTSPLTYSISSGLGISQSNGGTNGYLSSTDWTLFNNKIGSTSLSATSPLSYNS